MKKVGNHPNKQRENPWTNLLINIVIPALVMMKGQAWFGLSAQVALVLALAFPVSYGLYDFFARKKYNAFSIIGFVSILLTGGIGLLKLPKEWIAVKEAAVPLVLGVIVLASLKTRSPLVRLFLYNDQIIQINKVDAALDRRKKHDQFELLLRHCTYLLALSFLLSAVLNYILAKAIVKSEAGTPGFTEELGQMALWSYPVIVLPCMVVMGIALWKLISGLKRLTDLEIEEIFITPDSLKEKKDPHCLNEPNQR